MSFGTISVVGLGYIGLPTAAVFASEKQKVIGIDVNPRTVDIINRGNIHIIEPDLDQVVARAVRDGYLRAAVTPEPADAFLIAVPTPFAQDHQPDLRYVRAAAESIAGVLKKVIWLSWNRPHRSVPRASLPGGSLRYGLIWSFRRRVNGRIFTLPIVLSGCCPEKS